MLTINNERIEQRKIFGEEMIDIGQIYMGEMTRGYGEEEVARMIEEIVKNNKEIIKMQKLLAELLVKVEEEKRKESREMERKREKE